MSISQKMARRATAARVPPATGTSASNFAPGIVQTDGSKNIAGDAPVWLDPPSSVFGGGVNYVPPKGINQ